jgi:hypothetical protein
MCKLFPASPLCHAFSEIDECISYTCADTPWGVLLNRRIVVQIIRISKNRQGSYLIGPKKTFYKKRFLISFNKNWFRVCSVAAKCSNIKILAKIKGKESNNFYLGQKQNYLMLEYL